jgi:aspartate kinase
VKFGGAALERPAAVVERLTELRRGPSPVIAVVSARLGVTDRLMRVARAPGDSELRDRTLTRLRHDHPAAEAGVSRALAALERAVAWTDRRGAPDPRALDTLLASGERLAVEWLVPRLRAAGLPAVGVDAAALGLWTDGRYGAGQILLDRARTPVRRGLGRIVRTGRIPVVTGYFGRGSRGEPVTLGRGGSDYSASAIGALVGASAVELVKRDASILSADPRIVPEARPVGSLTYAEAEELAEFGAQVLHPMAVEPARRAGIELRVRSLDRPSELTVIGPDASDGGVRAVTTSPPVHLWRLRFPGGRGRAGVLAELSAGLAAAGVPVLQAFTSAAVVTVVVDHPRRGNAERALRVLVAERRASLEGPTPAVLVAVVGAGAISALPRYPASLLSAAAGVSATRSSVTLALPARERTSASRALHRALLG